MRASSAGVPSVRGGASSSGLRQVGSASAGRGGERGERERERGRERVTECRSMSGAGAARVGIKKIGFVLHTSNRGV